MGTQTTKPKKRPAKKKRASPVVKRPDGGPWLSPEETSNRTGVSAHTLAIWRMTNKPGRPLSHKLGKYVWYLESDVQEWIAAQRETA